MRVIWLTIFTLLLVLKPLSAGFSPTSIKMCVKQSKVRSVDLALFYGTEYTQASKSAKCYLTCLLESINLIAEGKINAKLMEPSNLSNPNTAFVSRMLQNCQNLKAESECDIGLELFKCLITFAKSHMVKPVADVEKGTQPTN